MMSLEIAVAYSGYLDVVMITLSLSYVCQSIQKFRKPTRSCERMKRVPVMMEWRLTVHSSVSGERSEKLADDTTPEVKTSSRLAVTDGWACWTSRCRRHCMLVPSRPQSAAAVLGICLIPSSRHYFFIPVLIVMPSSLRNCTVQVSGLDHVGCVIEDQAEHKTIWSNSIDCTIGGIVAATISISTTMHIHNKDRNQADTGISQ